MSKPRECGCYIYDCYHDRDAAYLAACGEGDAATASEWAARLAARLQEMTEREVARFRADLVDRLVLVAGHGDRAELLALAKQLGLSAYVADVTEPEEMAR